MVLHEFSNDYGMILWSILALLNRFEKEDTLFAAQCIWCQESIVQFTEILTYYRHYKIFPSHYLRECVVTPLTSKDTSNSENNQDSDISEINLNEDEGSEFLNRNIHSSQHRLLPVF